MSAKPEPVVRWLDQDAPLPGTGSRGSKPRRSSWLPGIAIGVLVLTLVHERLGERDLTGPVPEEFVGVWRTTEPRYLDRGFTITPDSLWLQLGSEVTIAYPLVGARKHRVGDAAQYTIVYGDSPSVLGMDLQLNPDSTLHLANLPSVQWRKDNR